MDQSEQAVIILCWVLYTVPAACQVERRRATSRGLDRVCGRVQIVEGVRPLRRQLLMIKMPDSTTGTIRLDFFLTSYIWCSWSGYESCIRRRRLHREESKSMPHKQRLIKCSGLRNGGGGDHRYVDFDGRKGGKGSFCFSWLQTSRAHSFFRGRKVGYFPGHAQPSLLSALGIWEGVVKYSQGQHRISLSLTSRPTFAVLRLEVILIGEVRS